MPDGAILVPEPLLHGLGVKALVAGSKQAIGYIRTQTAVRGSEFDARFQQPSAQRELDAAFRLLAGEAGGLLDTAGVAIKALLTQRPEVFRSEDARLFISRDEIVTLGKAAVRETFQGKDIGTACTAAGELYAEMFDGDGLFGVRIFEDAVAFAAKAILVLLTPGDRVLLETLQISAAEILTALEAVSTRLDALWTAQKHGFAGESPDSQTFGVPRPTRTLISRPRALERLVACLTDSRDTASAVVALVGQGGSGKSTTAAMLVADPAIKAAFSDGVFWVTLGQTPDLALCQGVWLNFIAQRPLSFPSIASARAYLAAHFDSKAALLIIDDVWSASDLAALAVGGPLCRTLITTREQGIAQAGLPVALDKLTNAESIALLKIRTARGTQDDADLERLADKVGHLPLALELAAYQLSAGMPPDELISALDDELAAMAALALPGAAFEHDVEIAKNRSLDACLTLSVRRMPPALLAQFARLSVLRPGTAFGAPTVKTLCDITLETARSVLRQLWAMSLLEEEPDSEDHQRYRMHALIRAKARTHLIGDAPDAPAEATVVAVTLRYLQHSNARFPEAWHEITGDLHLRDNLVHYLARTASETALRSLLRSHDSDARTANSWHRMRVAAAQEELFSIETQQIFAYFVARQGATSLALDGLLRAHLTLVSLGDMNRDIDRTLCLALLESELWTEGQAASHAQRRFSPVDMARIALRLGEPLRSMTLLYATRLASRAGPDSGMAGQLVRAAGAFEDVDRVNLARLARDMMATPLGLRVREDQSNETSGPFASRTGFLRAALALAGTLNADEIDGWTPDSWIDTFLHNYEHMPLIREHGGLMFRDRVATHQPTVDLIETLLLLGDHPDPGFAARAAALADTILENLFGDLQTYARLRFVARFQRGRDRNSLRETAIEALAATASKIWSDAPNAELLGAHEGIDGAARLMAANFGPDPALYQALTIPADPSPLLLAFLREVLAGTPTVEFMTWLGTAFDGVVARFARTGSIGPEDSRTRFTPSPSFVSVIRMLAVAGLFKTRLDVPRLLADLTRVEGDLDRIALVEAFLPYIDQVEVGLARDFCTAVAHPQSAVTAWLAFGARVDAPFRAAFLDAAIRRVPDCSPAVALKVLSTHIPNYRGAHALEIARAAAAVAAGIGDLDTMRALFAQASVAIGDDARTAALRAPLWYHADTMPTHAVVAPLPRNRSVTLVPHWQLTPIASTAQKVGGPEYTSLAAAPLSPSAFHALVVARLSNIEAETSRIAASRDLVEFAQDYYLRGDIPASVQIAQALYETAMMYR